MASSRADGSTDRAALVIGGTGFLGGAIVRDLTSTGWSVDVVGRGRLPATVPPGRFLAADRARPGALRHALDEHRPGWRFDLVVDCAAYAGADAEDAVDAFDGRVEHYVLISSDMACVSHYDGSFPISEDAPRERMHAYGAGKVACEEALARAWQERGFPGTALRPPHIVGDGRELGTGSVEARDPDLLRHLRTGTGLTLVAEGALLTQPVWHREIAACIRHLAGLPAAFGQVFTIAGPDCVTVRGYYEQIAALLGVPLRAHTVSLEEYRARWPEKAFGRHRIYDTGKLQRLTGYRPHLPLSGAIAEAVAWLHTQEQAGGPR